MILRCVNCGKVNRCSGSLCILCIVKLNPNWPRKP